MAKPRIHAVDADSEKNRGQDLAPVTLCGITLISDFAWIMGPSVMWAKGDLSSDEYMKLRRRVRVYPVGDLPWVTVEEFAWGEDGCDDIDCGRCRKLLRGALKRYWGA